MGAGFGWPPKGGGGMTRENGKGTSAPWEVRCEQVRKILLKIEAELELIPRSESRKLIRLWVAGAQEALK